VPLARFSEAGGGSIELWAEDCLVGLPQRVGSRRADVVVTSPPYNRGVAYHRYDDRRPRSEYLAWIGRVADAVRASLSPDGSFFLNVGGSPTDPWLPLDVAQEVRQRFVLQNVIHWVKSIAIERALAGHTPHLTGDVAVGHYKPVPSPRFLHGAQEYVFHFTHRGDVVLDRLAVGVPYQDKSNVARWRAGRQDIRCRGNTWFLPYATIRRRATDRPHPATFPPELPERCYRLHGLGRIRLAVDPFVGLGASAVAAARCGLPFIGFDVDEQYLSTASRRVEAALTPSVRPVVRRRRNPHSNRWPGS
jgi:site-specific DNA-methyltransferase (adenine-specific)